MAHAHHEEHLSPEEKKFREYFQRATDLRKIELYRYAKYWFRESLQFNMQTAEVQAAMDENDEMIRKETRSIIAVVCVAAVLIVASMLLF